MDKRFQAVEAIIHFWVLGEEKRQRESLSTSLVFKQRISGSHECATTEEGEQERSQVDRFRPKVSSPLPFFPPQERADPPRLLAEKGEGKGEGFDPSRPIKPPHPNLLPLVKGEKECWVGLNSVNLSKFFRHWTLVIFSSFSYLLRHTEEFLDRRNTGRNFFQTVTAQGFHTVSDRLFLNLAA